MPDIPFLNINVACGVGCVRLLLYIYTHYFKGIGMAGVADSHTIPWLRPQKKNPYLRFGTAVTTPRYGGYLSTVVFILCVL